MVNVLAQWKDLCWKEAWHDEATWSDDIEQWVASLCGAEDGIEKALHQDAGGRTILHWAAERHQTVLVRCLLTALPSRALEIQDARGRTPLMAAIRRKKSPSYRKTLTLLWSHSDRNCRALKDVRGRTALHLLVARLKGRKFTAEILPLLSTLTEGEVMAVDNDGNTVLHSLGLMRTNVLYGSCREREVLGSAPAMVATLVRACRPRALLTKNERGETPLHFAARQSNRVVLMELLGHATHDEQLCRDANDHTFLYWACMQRPERILWHVVAEPRPAFYRNVPVSEVSLQWNIGSFTNSLVLTACYVAPLVAMSLLKRVPGTLLRNRHWLIPVIRAAILKDDLLMVEYIISRVGDQVFTWLPENNGDVFDYDIVRLMVSFGHGISERDAAAGGRIVARAPDEYFHLANGVLDAAIRRDECYTIIVTAILKRTPRSELLQREALVRLLSHSARCHIHLLLGCVTDEAMRDSLFFNVVTKSFLRAGTMQELAPFFSPDAIHSTTDQGDTVIHVLVRRSNHCTPDLVRYLLSLSPGLKYVTNHAGELPLDIAVASRVRANQELLPILAKPVKRAT